MLVSFFSILFFQLGGSLLPAMFKKLKQKIEEGGDGGIEKATFSPRKLPGSVVRSSSQNEDPVTPKSTQTVPAQTQESPITMPPNESRDEDQGITLDTVTLSSRDQEQVRNSCWIS